MASRTRQTQSVSRTTDVVQPPTGRKRRTAPVTPTTSDVPPARITQAQNDPTGTPLVNANIEDDPQPDSVFETDPDNVSGSVDEYDDSWLDDDDDDDVDNEVETVNAVYDVNAVVSSLGRPGTEADKGLYAGIVSDELVGAIESDGPTYAVSETLRNQFGQPQGNVWVIAPTLQPGQPIPGEYRLVGLVEVDAPVVG